MISTAYLMHILILIGIWAILATSLNLALGYTGLLNLGHVAFFAVGAYTSAILTTTLGHSMYVGLLAAGVAAAITAAVLMYSVKGLKGDYLALATLGFSFVTTSVLLNWDSLTRGARGIPGIPRPELLASTQAYLIFTLAVAVISIWILVRVARGPLGRLFEALRDDEVGLQSLGKNTQALKIKSLMLSAFFAGLAGSLYAHYITFIEPNSFVIHELILVLTIVLVGGIASMKGSIAATIVLLLIPEALRFLAIPTGLAGPLRQIIYAVILIAILLYNPRGMYGDLDLQ